MIIASPSDFTEVARRKLPRFLFDYLDGGAGEEMTLQRNLSDLSSIVLPQRVLTQVSEVHLGIELRGRKQALPVVLAPVGLTGMFAHRGEVQAAAPPRLQAYRFVSPPYPPAHWKKFVPTPAHPFGFSSTCFVTMASESMGRSAGD